MLIPVRDQIEPCCWSVGDSTSPDGVYDLLTGGATQKHLRLGNDRDLQCGKQSVASTLDEVLGEWKVGGALLVIDFWGCVLERLKASD